MPNITKVKCIDTAQWNDITIGKVYEVCELLDTYLKGDYQCYLITNDRGVQWKYRTHLFTIELAYPNPPHVHADVIKAWADGAEVQYRHHVNTPWKRSGDSPAFAPTTLYRVKPILDEQAIAECERKIDSATRGVVAANSVIIELKQQLKQLKNGE